MRGHRSTAALWAEANFDDEACSSCADTRGSKSPQWSPGFFITLTAGIRVNFSSAEHEGLIWLMPQHTTNKVVPFTVDFFFFLLFTHLSLKLIVSAH